MRNLLKSEICISLPQETYNVHIASDSLDRLGARLSRKGTDETAIVDLGQQILIVSNPVVFELYGDRVVSSLQSEGYRVCCCILPAGEQYKTLASIEKIYDVAYTNRLERSSAVVALGGGIIGDMAGFAASTWLRGISVIQVPTSLLAMVDASIGGKTGVNQPGGKNLIGAFHQPKFVLTDPTLLKTLPVREFRAGMAEVIKYGVIWDKPLFEKLEAVDRFDDCAHISSDLLQYLLEHSCQSKADVVSRDVKESGIRAFLNYGHTTGHAIESLTNYSKICHGEAVAIGMVAAGRIAAAMNLWKQPEAERQENLIRRSKLPICLPKDVGVDNILISMKNDKKVKAGKVRFVLPVGIGKACISDLVEEDLVKAVLSNILC